MPSPISINVKMKPYLIQFLVNRYGSQPIIFPKKDRFGSIVPQLLRKPLPEENQFEFFNSHNLIIVLSYCEQKNVLYHNYMPHCSQRLFETIIQREFMATFHHFMNEAFNCRVKITEAVNVFIELNHLDPNCTDMLIKERQRYMNYSRLSKWREKKKRQLNKQVVASETLDNKGNQLKIDIS